jgi:hypothetical protein
MGNSYRLLFSICVSLVALYALRVLAQLKIVHPPTVQLTSTSSIILAYQSALITIIPIYPYDSAFNVWKDVKLASEVT